jgi:hypothetical protein
MTLLPSTTSLPTAAIVAPIDWRRIEMMSKRMKSQVYAAGRMREREGEIIRTLMRCMV